MSGIWIPYSPLFQRNRLKVQGIAGVRVARVDQYYSSAVTNNLGTFANGNFSADFTGAGPHVGANLVYALDSQGRISAFARPSGSLLVGRYNVNSGNTTAYLQASQQERVTRIVPVFETEVGLNLNVLPNANLSAGWLFQSWFDLGTSGGTFGGLFNGADDSNIMSFEGLMVRAQLAF